MLVEYFRGERAHTTSLSGRQCCKPWSSRPCLPLLPPLSQFAQLDPKMPPHAPNLPFNRKENNGNDPTVNLIGKSSGWATGGASGSTSAGDDAAAAKQPERAIPAQPAPAWGGAGLPEERKKQVGSALAARDCVPATACRKAPSSASFCSVMWRVLAWHPPVGPVLSSCMPGRPLPARRLLICSLPGQPALWWLLLARSR